MNYIIKITHGTEYFINANTLLDLYNQLTKLKSKHCYYDDEIVSIEEVSDEWYKFKTKRFVNRLQK